LLKKGSAHRNQRMGRREKGLSLYVAQKKKKKSFASAPPPKRKGEKKTSNKYRREKITLYLERPRNEPEERVKGQSALGERRGEISYSERKKGKRTWGKKKKKIGTFPRGEIFPKRKSARKSRGKYGKKSIGQGTSWRNPLWNKMFFPDLLGKKGETPALTMVKGS